MPTAQAVAIREERAIERIKNCTHLIVERTGQHLPELNLNFRYAPVERQALTLEFLADLLEEIVGVIQDPLEVEEPEPEPEAKVVPQIMGKPEVADGINNKNPSRPSPKLKAKQTGRRSQTNRSR